MLTVFGRSVNRSSKDKKKQKEKDFIPGICSVSSNKVKSSFWKSSIITENYSKAPKKLRGKSSAKSLKRREE
jgi:hypothetical protein